MSVRDILDSARFPEGEVRICLRGDLERRRDQLRAEITARHAATSGRMAAPVTTDLDDALAAVEQEMAAATLTLRMRGVSSAEYNVLQRTEGGKPRPGHAGDQRVGFNVAQFYEALVRRCTYEVATPDGSAEQLDGDAWAALLGAVNDAQFDDLANCAQALNRQAPRPPTVAPTSAPPPNDT